MTFHFQYQVKGSFWIFPGPAVHADMARRRLAAHGGGPMARRPPPARLCDRGAARRPRVRPPAPGRPLSSCAAAAAADQEVGGRGRRGLTWPGPAPGTAAASPRPPPPRAPPRAHLPRRPDGGAARGRASGAPGAQGWGAASARATRRAAGLDARRRPRARGPPARTRGRRARARSPTSQVGGGAGGAGASRGEAAAAAGGWGRDAGSGSGPGRRSGTSCGSRRETPSRAPPGSCARHTGPCPSHGPLPVCVCVCGGVLRRGGPVRVSATIRQRCATYPPPPPQ